MCLIVFVSFFCCFFFKQKTAYEMRISDWSSDVCSSDLRSVEKLFGMTFFLDKPNPRRLNSWRAKAQQEAAEQAGYAFHSYAQAKFSGIIERIAKQIGRASCRDRVCQYV